MPLYEFEQIGNRTVVLWPLPAKASFAVAGEFRNRMVIGDEPDRNASSPETSSNRKASVRAAEDKGSGGSFDIRTPRHRLLVSGHRRTLFRIQASQDQFAKFFRRPSIPVSEFFAGALVSGRPGPRVSLPEQRIRNLQ